MKSLQERIGEYFIQGLVYFTAGWCVIALSMQCFFIYLEFSGNEALANKIANEVEIRIDGRYSNDPRNIWYK
jgi:hypothetical protein